MIYKWGMTEDGNLVILPTDKKIIWKFMSYPSDKLFKDIYATLKGKK